MGLFRALFPKKIKDPLTGTAQIVSCSGTSENATHQTCEMQLVVNVEGVEPFAVAHTQILKVSKWPSPGMAVPVVVSQSDPTNLRLDFDAIPEWQDAGMDRAEQIAASMRGEGETGDGPQVVQMPGGGTAQVHVVNVSGGDVDPADLAQAVSMAEQTTGMDLDGDGKVASGAAPVTPPTAAAAGDDDRIAQLERLAKLHDSGALSDQEFEAEKARLLGGP